WAIDRLQADVIRAYDPGRWSEPRWEVSVGTGANPHDIALCGGRLFVSRYEHDHLLVLDPDTGAEVGTVDLSDLSDADGLPEASDLEVLDGRFYVGLHRLDRLAGWTSAPGGRLVEVDCDAMEATDDWEAGPN